MKSLREYLVLAEYAADNPVPGDIFDIAVSTDQLIETVITELTPDGSIIIELDEHAVRIMESAGMLFEEPGAVANDSTSPIHGGNQMLKHPDGEFSPINGSAFAPYDRKSDPREWFRKDVDHDDDENNGKEVHTHSVVTMNGTGYDKRDGVAEAKYHGRKVSLGKPMKGDVKKSKVYVKDPKTGNIKKVNFGDPNMRIKKSSPTHRKSFRARHHCENPGPRTSARYWSCRAW